MSIQRTRHRAQATKLTPPCEMNMTLETLFISMLKKAVTVKMRADVPMNLCTNYLKTNDDLGGTPPHPHDMAAANRTLSCDKKQTSSVLMNSLKLHISVPIYLSFLHPDTFPLSVSPVFHSTFAYPP